MRSALFLLPLLLGALIGVAWWADGPVAPGIRLSYPLLWLGCALLAVRAWRQPACGALSWDGQAWRWDRQGPGATGRIGRLQARLDWQTGLLLEFRSFDGHHDWLWVERGVAPAQWAALRRAVHGSGDPGGDGAASAAGTGRTP